MSTKRKKRKKKSLAREYRNEIIGVVLLVFSLFLFFSLISNLAGILGESLNRLIWALVGRGSLLFASIIGAWGLLKLVGKDISHPWARAIGVITLFESVLIVLYWLFPIPDETLFGLKLKGAGLSGALLADIILDYFGDGGTALLILSLSFISVILIAGVSFIGMAKWLYHQIMSIMGKAYRGIENLVDRWLTKIEESTKGLSFKLPSLKGRFKRRTVETTPITRSYPREKIWEEGGASPEGERKDIPIYNYEERMEDILKGEEEIAIQSEKEAHIYEPPPLSLLSAVQVVQSKQIKRELAMKAERLERALHNFGVEASIMEINRGPTITRFEVLPAPGVKVSRITSLSNDIALALAARSVRIEAPIPGKSAVGIEIPNRVPTPVYLREMLQTEEYINSKSLLTIALGRDVAGSPIIADLAQMPHLLIAGATGTGKSVCVNSVIVSILYKAKPSQVKFIMIDPKMVELAVYNGIPHLKDPVVTDAANAGDVLGKVIEEMENRYRIFAREGARDIHRYNEIVKDDRFRRELPQIVIIIDEFADLMAVAPKQMESSICRIAQMARATGIHLVLSTQRPSVDVITGLIKANIPSRISFAVSSQVDSRTILDMNGAEKLLGKGDMLYFPVNEPKPIRVQGSLVPEAEIEKLVEFLKKPHYKLRPLEAVEEPPSGEEEVDSILLERVLESVIEQGEISLSSLRKDLNINRNRAVRILDALEEIGVIEPGRKNKPRKVLVAREKISELLERLRSKAK